MRKGGRMTKANVLEGMDKAAKQAATELATLPRDAVAQVAGWWARWYMQAGHKRLGRALLVYAPASKERR